MQNTNTSVVGGHEDAMLTLGGDGAMGGEAQDTFWNTFLVDDACPLPTIGANPSFGLAGSGGGTLSGLMDMAPLVTAGPSMDLPTEVRPLPAPVAEDVEGEPIAADSCVPSPTEVTDALGAATSAAPAAKRHATKKAKPVAVQRFKEKVAPVAATAVDGKTPLSAASGGGDKVASARFLDMRDFDASKAEDKEDKDLDKPMSDTDVGALSDGGEGVSKLDDKKKARVLRNRESAANSRKRKRAQQQDLEALVASLKKTVETLQEENVELKRTVAGLVEEQSVSDFLEPPAAASDVAVA